MRGCEEGCGVPGDDEGENNASQKNEEYAGLTEKEEHLLLAAVKIKKTGLWGNRHTGAGSI